MEQMQSLSELSAAPRNEPACLGHVYRFLEAAYVGKQGQLVTRRELRPMKRLSCPGCEDCGGMEDVATGVTDEGAGFLQFDNDLMSGDLVRLQFVLDESDFESGHAERWHYEVKRLITQ